MSSGLVLSQMWFDGNPLVAVAFTCGRGLYHRVNSDSPGALRQRSTSVDRLWLVKGRRRPAVGQRPIETDFSRPVGQIMNVAPLDFTRCTHFQEMDAGILASLMVLVRLPKDAETSPPAFRESHVTDVTNSPRQS